MPRRKIKDLLRIVCPVLRTSEETVEKIHRKTLDENKQLFSTGTKYFQKVYSQME